VNKGIKIVRSYRRDFVGMSVLLPSFAECVLPFDRGESSEGGQSVDLASFSDLSQSIEWKVAIPLHEHVVQDRRWKFGRT
jgi:hypothetical protein